MLSARARRSFEVLRSLCATVLVYAIALFGQTAYAQIATDKTTGLDVLSQMRMQAGLMPLRSNKVLTKAAKAHANYLIKNVGISHQELPSARGFTGVSVGERARAAGYRSGFVAENIARGQTSGREAVEGLFSAIYHRFSLLAVDKDEVGAAKRLTSDGKPVYVYVLGNGELEALCAAPQSQGFLRRYVETCTPKRRIKAERYEQALEQSNKNAPEIILWPPDGAKDVPTVFFEEIPDPLPDRSFSGYPISVQVNPKKVKKVNFQSFRLKDLKTGADVADLRLMDKNNDPNHKFNTHEFALFPLQRLRWNHRYEAKINLIVDGRRVKRSWSFRTRGLPRPGYVITGSNENVTVLPDRKTTIYIPPAPGKESIRELQYSFPKGTEVVTKLIDPHTLEVQVRGLDGTRIEVRTGAGHHFNLYLKCGGKPIC